MKYKNLKVVHYGIGGNTVYEGNNFVISYNPCVMPSFFGAGGEEETALLHKGYLILDGDFRKEYDKCKNLKEALSFYKKNKKFRSNWSTD